jgi:RNA polymerase sigma factor (sigma-70 family)
MDDVFEALAAPDEATDRSRHAADLLATRAAPIVRRVAASRLGPSCSELDDVCAGVLLELLEHFCRPGGEQSLDGIADLENYVAQAAHHGCDRHLRSRNPSRWRLRNRVRYVLDHDDRFALWTVPDGRWRCGLAAWRGRGDEGATPPLDAGKAASADPRDLLAMIFERADGPLDLQALVDVCAAAIGLARQWRVDSSALDQIPDPQPTIEVTLQRQSHAARVWAHIRELPSRQRQALLLHLKDEAIRVLPVAGIASLAAIADALEMSSETLASIWNRLPLPDTEIAEHLGCTRQQVINLRMSARKRLANRLEDDG